MRGSNVPRLRQSTLRRCDNDRNNSPSNADSGEHIACAKFPLGYCKARYKQCQRDFGGTDSDLIKQPGNVYTLPGNLTVSGQIVNLMKHKRRAIVLLTQYQLHQV